MTDDDEARTRKVAANQSSFRGWNERLRRNAGSYRFEDTDRVPFVCECADQHCSEVVMLSIEQYEQVREHSRRFLLAAGHECAEHERIVEAENGYAIVEKTGSAGAEAARLDQRRGGD